MAISRSLTDVHAFEHDGVTYQLRTLPHRIMLAAPGLPGHEQLELTVRAGVAGATGLVQSDGAPAALTMGPLEIGGVKVKEGLTEDGYNALPFDHIPAIATAVLRVNKLTEEQAGNS